MVNKHDVKIDSMVIIYILPTSLKKTADNLLHKDRRKS